MLKRTKRGQALIETIVTLGIYIFMISFIVSGFQLIYNKTIFSIAAYQYAKTMVSYESSAKFSEDIGNMNASGGITHASYGITKEAKVHGEEAAKAIIESSTYARPLIHNITYNAYGMTADDFNHGIRSGSYSGRQHMYIQTVVKGEMDFLFPIVSADSSRLIADSAKISSAFTIAKERVYAN